MRFLHLVMYIFSGSLLIYLRQQTSLLKALRLLTLRRGTTEPVLGGTILSGYPVLRGHVKVHNLSSPNHCNFNLY